MNYSLFKHKKDDDSSVYIRASVSRAGRKSKVTIEKYDSIRLLDEKYGSWEKFIKERISVLKQQKHDLRKKARTITLDYSQSIDEHGLSFLKNAGYLLLQKVYYSLGIDQFIYHYKNNRNLKFEYSLNDVMRLLVFSRIISPASKLRTTQDAQSYLENFDVTLSDVYDGLTRIADFRGALQKYLYDKVRKILPPSDDVIYYDVTNFYYEIEDENEVAAYGVEKNHRPDPITSFGLFMDSNGVPIRYSDYRGNINESKQILPEWKELREETLNQDNSYIICTDAGLNSANLKYYCITRGDHYLFSQSVKKLAKDTLKDVFEKDGWVSMGDGRSYKVIKTIKNASVTDSTSKTSRTARRDTLRPQNRVHTSSGSSSSVMFRDVRPAKAEDSSMLRLIHVDTLPQTTTTSLSCRLRSLSHAFFSIPAKSGSYRPIHDTSSSRMTVRSVSRTAAFNRANASSHVPGLMDGGRSLCAASCEAKFANWSAFVIFGRGARPVISTNRHSLFAANSSIKRLFPIRRRPRHVTKEAVRFFHSRCRLSISLSRPKNMA